MTVARFRQLPPPVRFRIRAPSTFADAVIVMRSPEGRSCVVARAIHGCEQESMVPISTIIGLTAATCTTVSFLPQVIKAWRTRSTRDVSTGMFALLVTGNSLWLLYGALISDLPLVVTNLITLGLVVTILALKLQYG